MLQFHLQSIMVMMEYKLTDLNIERVLNMKSICNTRTIQHIFLFLVICTVIVLLPVAGVQAAELKLPSGLKRIEEQAFYGDTSLDAVTIQEGTEVIGRKAFARSSVKTITLPGSLYNIADDAFDGCENLTVHAEEGTYAYTWAVKNEYIKINGGAAGEVTKVIAPDTLRAGADLTVQIIGPADTIQHSVYIVNEETGEYQSCQLSKARDNATFDGYNFDAGGTYRLTVYTITKQYQALTPVNKTIRVTGQKPSVVAFEIPESVKLGQYFWIDYDGMTISKYKYYSIEGEQFDSGISWGDFGTWEFRNNGEGGRIDLNYAIYTNGLWSEWSETYTVLVIKHQYIVGDIDFPDNLQNGHDFSVGFEYDGYVDYYYYRFESEESLQKIASDNFWLSNTSGTGTMLISTQNLDQGRYTFKLYFVSEQEGVDTLVYEKSFDVVGTRTSAPYISINNNEVFVLTNNRIIIDTTNAEMVAVKREEQFGDYETSTDFRTFSSPGNTYTWYDYYYKHGNGDKQYICRYYFAVRKEGNWSAWTEPYDVIVKEKTKLASPNINATSPVAAGQDYVFSFDEVENATQYSASLKPSYSDTSIYTRTPVTPTDLCEIPGYMMSSGSYALEVNASAEGCEPSSQIKLISVIGSQSEGPDINVEEPLYWNQEAVFKIQTQNAEALQVRYKMETEYSSNSYQYISVPVSGAITQWSLIIPRYWQHYQSKTITVGASIRLNGIWTEWSAKTFSINGFVPLKPAEIHMDNYIEAGKDFRITVDPVEKAVRYEFGIYQSGSEVLSGSMSDIGELHYAGYELEPGQYTFRVRAFTENYSPAYYDDHSTNSTSEKEFTVVGSRNAAPTVRISETNVYDGEYCSFTINTTDADALVVKYRYANGEGIRIQGNKTVWTQAPYYSTWESNIWPYSFAVLKEGKWSAWSDTIYINVLPKPLLAEPIIHASETTGAGGDFSFTFSAVENATSYHASFASAYGGNSWESELAQPDTPLTVPGYLINPGSYKLTVSANAEGYAKATKTMFITANGQRPSAPEITVNEPLRIKSTAVFSINSEGAEALQVNYQYTSPNNWWSEQNINVPVTGNTTEWSLQIDENKQGVNLTVSFSLKKEGVWSSWKTKAYMIEGLPSLDQAVIQLDDTIEAGKDFGIIVDPVENATRYEFSIYQSERYIRSGSRESSIGEIRFAGYELDPGVYTIRVWAYSNDYATSTSERIFTIAGDKSTAPTATVDKTNVFTEENYTFTIETIDADALVVRYGNSNDNRINIQGDQTQWSHYAYESGNRSYRFAVLREGKWSEWSDTIGISVRNRPNLTEPVIQAMDTINAGSDYTFSFSAVENADSYSVSFGSAYDNNTLFSWGSDSALADTNLTVPGYLINSGSYRLRVSAYAEGYTPSSKTHYVTTSGRRPAGPSISVEEPIRIKNTAVFAINTEDAEALQVKYQYTSPNNWWSEENISVPVVGNITEWPLQISEYMEGVNLTISFSTKTEDVWSAWKTKTYMIAGLPQLDAPEIIAQNSYVAGHDIQLSFTPVEGATTYRKRVYKLENGSQTSIYNSSGSSTAPITLNGYSITPGQYKFTVEAADEEYKSNSSSHEFTVVEYEYTSEHISVSVDKTEFYSNEAYPVFTVTATGAEAIRCNNGYAYQVDENGTVRIKPDMYIYNGNEREYSFSFCAVINDVWSEWTEPITIKIKKAIVPEPDPLEEAVIHLPENILAGQDFVFSFDAVDGATTYEAYISRYYTDSTVYSKYSATPATNMTVSGRNLTAGTYVARVYASGTGRTSSTSQITFKVTGERAEAPNVTTDKNQYAAGDTVIFSINTEDAEEIFIGYSFEGRYSSYGSKSIIPEGNSTEWTYSIPSHYYGETYTFTFNKKSDGRWSKTENIVFTTPGENAE